LLGQVTKNCFEFAVDVQLISMIETFSLKNNTTVVLLNFRGARHGIKMNGKLQRLQEQEEQTDETIEKKKKKKKHKSIEPTE